METAARAGPWVGEDRPWGWGWGGARNLRTIEPELDQLPVT